MESAQNEEFLRNLAKNQFLLPESFDVYSFLCALLPNLRSTDAELRDNLSYYTFVNLLNKYPLTAGQLEDLLELVASEDFLRHRIGEDDTDSVFGRSFSVLIVAAIIDYDTKRLQLSAPCVQETLHVVLDYAKNERDYRGYVDGKGWAHAVAHTADALDSFAQHPLVTNDTRLMILEAIAHLASLSSPLTYMEDDRLAYPVLRMVEAKQLSQDCFESWLTHFRIDHIPPKAATLQHVNAAHFLRSLYFLLHWQLPNHPWLPLISTQLMQMNIFYKYGILTPLEPSQ